MTPHTLRDPVALPGDGGEMTMFDDDELDAIAAKAFIEVSISCDECKMEMRSEDEFDTD